MKNCFEDMSYRGFFYQTTDEIALKSILNEKQISFYVGFDPTADSLHIGHLLPVMAARRLQLFGHKPIMLVGGATALIGDPSGKQEARPILSKETVAKNVEGIKAQLSKYIDFTKATMVNNADWFSNMLYVDMLREIGPHFSVNRMLSMDSVKMRMETGISFLEFNYMTLQSYDFVHLWETHQCELQIGGQDQWGNIVMGVELGRRMKGKSLFGATFPLLLDSNGQKFGKSVAGAVWLDKNKTSIFDYYQFWRNTCDADVYKLLYYFTSLPSDEIEKYKNLDSSLINRVKEILAYEATALAHGHDEAAKIFVAAGTKFGFADPESRVFTSSRIKEIASTKSYDNLPTFALNKSDVEKGISIVTLLTSSGLSSSNGDARRLIQGGGAYIGENKITDFNLIVTLNDFINNETILKSGKKNIRRIIIG